MRRDPRPRAERIAARDPDRRTAETHARVALTSRFSAPGSAEIARVARTQDERGTLGLSRSATTPCLPIAKECPHGRRPNSEEIRAAREADPRLRERDLAARLGVPEAAVVAAHIGGKGLRATRIAAHPDRLMPAAARLGEAMALTRNEAVVSEVAKFHADPGTPFGEGALRGGYHPHEHAAMVLERGVDLRIFPCHWAHAFAVGKEAEGGPLRSLQVFDAAGDALHKVYARGEVWEAVVAD